jgi:hypothetical protein
MCVYTDVSDVFTHNSFRNPNSGHVGIKGQGGMMGAHCICFTLNKRFEDMWIRKCKNI